MRGESVCPEVANDLFVAHLSIYHFFARFAPGKRVLDVGCGTGYGAALLRAHGAADVLGLDRDARSIRYARRRFGADGVRFAVADAEALPADLGSFELIVSSNVFEHLEDPGPAVRDVRRHLVPGGLFLLAVPPITDDATLRANQANPFHRSNLYVAEWLALLHNSFRAVRTYQHRAPADAQPDFRDPRRSGLRADAFRFEEVTPEDLASAETLGAVFIAT